MRSQHCDMTSVPASQAMQSPNTVVQMHTFTQHMCVLTGGGHSLSGASMLVVWGLGCVQKPQAKQPVLRYEQAAVGVLLR